MKTVARVTGRWPLLGIAIGLSLVGLPASRAAEPAKGAAAKPDSGPNASVPADPVAKPASKLPLDKEQNNLAERYANLEKAMNRMAEVVGQNDPRQAAVLRQAFAESRQKLLDDRFS